ncbi:TPA: bifunctional endoribonuclease/protein kinase ire1 [Trebouxia sp. C0004]
MRALSGWKGDVGFPSHFKHILEQELGSAEGWQQAIHPDLMDNMTKYNRFRPDSWQDLLRFVRNMHRHYTAQLAQDAACLAANPGLQLRRRL